MRVSREEVNGKRLQTFGLVDDFLEPRSEGTVIGTRSRSGLKRLGIHVEGLVQYGLKALNDGIISKQQFLDLNAGIGGFDNDGNLISTRTVGDEAALQAVHGTGRVLYGGEGSPAHRSSTTGRTSTRSLTATCT
jgi:hypothetical protein